MPVTSKSKLNKEHTEALIKQLETRFEKNKSRHPNIAWSDVLNKLIENPSKLWSLNEMENTEGEPDVIGLDKKTGEFIFCDCAPESPKGRRSICYDIEALESRKEHKPHDSAIEMAKNMGIEILSEATYKDLQKLGKFDSKTSSWIETPADIRKLGGALFADYRFGHVFIYHNGAESYYAARGFRGLIRV